jgi:hypothetical protein
VAFHQQAADELGGDDLSWTAVKGLWEGWEALIHRGTSASRSQLAHAPLRTKADVPRISPAAAPQAMHSEGFTLATVLIGGSGLFVLATLFFGTKGGYYDTDNYDGNGTAH